MTLKILVFTFGFVCVKAKVIVVAFFNFYRGIQKVSAVKTARA